MLDLPRHVLLALTVLALPGPAFAIEVSGPVAAELVRVIDGDTILVDAHIWPGHRVRVSVRLRGIDAPELRTRCAAEKRAAERARDALAGMIGSKPIEITNIGGGKYYGRVLADARSSDGADIAEALLRRDLVRPYGEGRRLPFCKQPSQ
jgi:micrococcal nuclease